MKIFETEIALISISVLLSRLHARLIKEERPIHHGWWAALFGIFAALMTWYALPDLQHAPFHILAYVAAQCCSHLLFFNIFLNLFRELPWTYVSPTSTSILEGWEYHLFGHRTWLLDGLCAAIFVGLQFLL